MKKTRNGLTQRQRKTRTRRVAEAIHLYYVRQNVPMRGHYWSTKGHGEDQAEAGGQS